MSTFEDLLQRRGVDVEAIRRRQTLADERDTAARKAAAEAAKLDDDDARREASASPAERAAELRRIAHEVEALSAKKMRPLVSERMVSDLCGRADAFGGWRSDLAARAEFRRMRCAGSGSACFALAPEYRWSGGGSTGIDGLRPILAAQLRRDAADLDGGTGGAPVEAGGLTMDPLLEHLGIPECKRVAAKGALGRLARGELKGEWNRFKDGIKEPLKNPKPGQRAKWLWNVALAGEFLEAWLNRDSET